MILCTQLLRLYALLPEKSVLNVCFGGDLLACLFLNVTGLGSVYCKWSVRLFTSDAVWIQLDHTVILRVVTVMGNNGLYNSLLEHLGYRE